MTINAKVGDATMADKNTEQQQTEFPKIRESLMERLLNETDRRTDPSPAPHEPKRRFVRRTAWI